MKTPHEEFAILEKAEPLAHELVGGYLLACDPKRRSEATAVLMLLCGTVAGFMAHVEGRDMAIDRLRVIKAELARSGPVDPTIPVAPP